MSTQRRVFPESFRREAVDRVAASGPSAGAVARKLGLHETVLPRWDAVRGAGDGGGVAPQPAGDGPVAVLSGLGGGPPAV